MEVRDKEQQDQSINIGALLVEARDNLGLTNKDIANTLNLAEEVIDKIEKNDFEQDIPIAFIRGYIKSYATKVGLDTSPILAAFDQQTSGELPSLKRAQSISVFDKKTREINSSHYLFKAVSTLIVIAFLSFAGWELWKRLSNTAAVTNEAQYSYGTLSSDISSELETTNDIDLNNSDSENLISTDTSEIENTTSENTQLRGDVVQQQNSDAQNIELSITDSSNAISAGLVDDSNLIMTNIVLDFTADCWVKITDARGEVLAEGVKVNGKHMPLTGAKPITVILGDPSVVTMSYADELYDLSVYQAGRRVEIILN